MYMHVSVREHVFTRVLLLCMPTEPDPVQRERRQCLLGAPCLSCSRGTHDSSTDNTRTLGRNADMEGDNAW